MNTLRVTTIWALLFALSLSPLAGTARAAENVPSPSGSPVPRAPLSLSQASASVLAGAGSDPMWQSWSVMAQRGHYRGGRSGRRGSGAGALIFGAVATITGAAILAYANRPDCNTNPQLSGCGYGTKVVGTSVLAGGVVGVVVGATLLH